LRSRAAATRPAAATDTCWCWTTPRAHCTRRGGGEGGREGGHGGLMVRKGPAAGSNVSTTAAVRWSGRHEALSSHIGVFAVLVVVSASFSS